MAGEGVVLLGRAHSVDFHGAIVEIARPAANPNGIGGMLHEPTEADALYTAGNEPSACFNGFAQAVVSELSRAGGFSLSTDWTAPASFFTVKGLEMSWKPLLTTYRCTT